MGFGGGVGEVVEGVGVDFLDARAEEAADQVFVAFEVGLEEDEKEVGAGGGGGCLGFYELDL